jgi:hypothetical protein
VAEDDTEFYFAKNEVSARCAYEYVIYNTSFGVEKVVYNT